MAQKEWKREEMKQNQGRTEQNQRKKVQKKTGYRAVLAASMFLIAASAALSACKKSPAAETTAQTQALASGAAIVIVLTLLTGSTRYNGSGVSLIEKCFEGEGLPWDFLIKILFTTVTLEAGFKGGEIVPTLTIGAAFGSFFAFLFGQPVGLMTACGMLGLFVGVTNCPISTLLLGFELFGYEAMPFFVLVIAVSFSFSGYYSLYASQKFIYSKTRTEFINRKTNK